MKVVITFVGFLTLICASAIGGPMRVERSQSREELAAVAHMPAIAGSQMVGPGATNDITISIDSYSTNDEAKAMAAAFTQGQHKALRKALEKATAKARVAFTGRNGYYEFKLLRTVTTPNGRQIFGVGERAIRFLDAYYSGRSHLEEFGILQLELTSNNGVAEGSGTLLHKAKIKSLEANSIKLDDNGIEPVRLTIGRQ